MKVKEGETEKRRVE